MVILHVEDVQRHSLDWKKKKIIKIIEFLIFMSAFSTQCALLSKRFIEDYSSDRFQILYSDATDTVEVQGFRITGVWNF